MNRDNLRTILNVIKEVPVGALDMGIWGSGKLEYDPEKGPVVVEDACGSYACFAGWTYLYLHPGEIVHFEEVEDNRIYTEAAAWLEVDTNTDLFYDVYPERIRVERNDAGAQDLATLINCLEAILSGDLSISEKGTFPQSAYATGEEVA